MEETGGQSTVGIEKGAIESEPTPLHAEENKEAQMQEVFQEATKNMEKLFEPWKQAMGGNFTWMKGSELAKMSKCSPWIAKMREAYQANLPIWESFADQAEELFTEMIKANPFKTDEMESRLKEMMQNLRSQNKAGREVLLDNLGRMEKMAKDWEQAMSSYGIE